MDSTCIFTQINDSASTARNGGLILKGRTRSTRQPVHMTLVVDTSGSMDTENKLTSVKRSIQLLLDLLSPEDRISLVTFSDSSKIYLSRAIPTPEERQAILYRISALKADGSTNMSAGLLDARTLVEIAEPTRKQGLVLLTDGHANLGVSTAEGLTEIIRRIQSESPGLTVTTVAYGLDHNAELLTQLASTGGGAYNVVKNLEDVATVFGDILGGLMSVSAQNVEVQLPPGAEANTSYRTSKDAAGMTTVYIGDLYSDSEITLLFKSAPSQGPLRIKGTDMATLNRIDQIVEPTLLTAIGDIPVTLIVAEYRQQTADILKQISQGQSLVTLRPRTEELIRRIQDDDRVRDHPLKPILLEDLENALRISQRNTFLSREEVVEAAQHSAFISMTRGLRTNTNHVPALPPPRARRTRNAAVVGMSMAPDDSQEDPMMPPVPAAAPGITMTSPFANRAQTQMASVMRHASMQPEEESQ